MIYYLTSNIKDAVGNNYVGVKIPKGIVDPFLLELKDILGDKYESYIDLQQKRDHNEYHITVINVMDYNKLSKDIGMDKFINSLESDLKYPIDDIQMLGIGTATKTTNTTYFVVCRSEKLKAIRDKYNLPEQDFHITLGFLHKDVFGVRKNIVLGKKSKFLQLLAQEYLKKENFEFLKKIENYSYDKDIDIVPVSISETSLKIKVADYLLDIGLMDDPKQLYIFAKYKDDKDTPRMSTTELLKFLKNKI